MNNPFETDVAPEALPHFHGFIGLPHVFNPTGWLCPVSSELSNFFELHWAGFASEVDDNGRHYFDLETFEALWEDLNGWGFQLIAHPEN